VRDQHDATAALYLEKELPVPTESWPSRKDGLDTMQERENLPLPLLYIEMLFSGPQPVA
jgi:hypothetical protein